MRNTSHQARHGDMTATQLVTAEELYRMGSDAPYELWEGVLKEVSPSSFKPGVVAARVVGVLINYVDAHNLGYVSTAESGYILNTNPFTVVAPDVAFVRGDRYPGGLPESGFSPLPPDLAVEVISPTDRKSDIAQKQALYAKAGVPLVWWVDPERKTVTVYRLGQEPEIIDSVGVLDGGDVLPGFELKVQSIFRD
jgi:Uma2 family endonuclease